MPCLLLVAVVVLALAAGCGGDDDESWRAGPTVVATTTQVADLVKNVGGARVEVRRLLRPGADPHEYEPRPSDVRAVAGAAVVFESGGDLDGWLEDVIDGAGGEAREVRLIDSVEVETDGSGEEDPHWWHDPANAVRAVAAIRAALVAEDPSGRSGYEARAARFSEQIERLDAQLGRCFASIPAARRKAVTTHDALGYLTRSYGIVQVGSVIPSLSTQAQASAGDVEDLVDRIRAEKVRAIFPETALNPRLEKAIAREAGVRVGAALWADSLGAPGSGGATYLEATAANGRALAEGMDSPTPSCARLGQ